MKIKYEIELDNEVIGVDSTVAKVLITHKVNGAEEMLSGVYILRASIDDASTSVSPSVASAMIEAVMKITGQDMDLEKKKPIRRKKNAEDTEQ